ncbi:MAG: zf-HC2 domain-containing protein [Acidobacteria bacterium]|nr:zf-HC2 domain-containing protein [Acidobacteriota bacterium]
MKISCQEVWREVSNYLEDDLTPELRSRIEAHVKGCVHCSAIVDGTKNVVELVCDDRAFALPEGFSRRLSQRLAGRARERK